MNTDLVKAQALTIEQQQVRRRLEFQVNRCTDKRAALIRLDLQDSEQWETNEAQLAESTAQLTAFDDEFLPEGAEGKAAPEPELKDKPEPKAKKKR